MMDDWMPCFDEMPEYDEMYLVTWVGDIGKSGGKFRGIEMLEYYDGKWDTEKIEKRGYRNVRVTAWMELPEPWEEDEE